MIPQPSDAGMAKRTELLPKYHSIFTRLLRHLYDFPHPICHILQRQGERRRVIYTRRGGCAEPEERRGIYDIDDRAHH